MTLKQLIKPEERASEVCVISLTLHYDTENVTFTELVSKYNRQVRVMRKSHS